MLGRCEAGQAEPVTALAFSAPLSTHSRAHWSEKGWRPLMYTHTHTHEVSTHADMRSSRPGAEACDESGTTK